MLQFIHNTHVVETFFVYKEISSYGSVLVALFAHLIQLNTVKHFEWTFRYIILSQCQYYFNKKLNDLELIWKALKTVVIWKWLAIFSDWPTANASALKSIAASRVSRMTISWICLKQPIQCTPATSGCFIFENTVDRAKLYFSFFMLMVYKEVNS